MNDDEVKASVNRSAKASWHTQAVESVFDSLASSPVGLSAAEAARHLAQHGPNRLPDKRTMRWWTWCWPMTTQEVVMRTIRQR